MNSGWEKKSEESLMALQHHHDEYTMTDIRYTLGEVWRVIRDRRWFFIAPSCVVATIALLCSLWVPRTFTATTIVKREQDPVLASMMGQAWTEPYGEIRKRIASDMADMEFVAEALDDLNLPPDLQRFENDELTPGGASRRAALAREVIEGLNVTQIDSSSSRDIVEMSLAMRDPTHLTEILTHLRDKYAALAKKKTSSILRDAQKFFQAESDKCRAKLSGLQKQILDYEVKYPGIDPQIADPTLIGQAAMITERIDLERKLEDLTSQQEQLAATIASLTKEVDDAAGEVAIELMPNPQIAEIEGEIRALEDELLTSKTIRLMTDEHPSVVRLRRTLDTRRAEMAGLPAMVPNLGNTETTGPSPREEVETRLSHVEAKIAAAQARVDEIGTQIERMEKRRVEAAEHREAYLKVRQQADRTRGELEGWQANLGPIGHVLTIEDSNRGIIFSILQEATRASKPDSPDSLLVVLVCLAIGVAAGALTVLLAELLDHSFRTVKQISSSLGVPVIEGVDEILTQRKRRQRMMRQLILMPAVTTLLMTGVVAAGAVAYLSIEKPERFERIKQSPHRAYEIALGEGEM